MSELSATSPSVLITLSGSVSELALLRFYLYERFTTWSKKFVFNFGIDILRKLPLFIRNLWVHRPSLLMGTGILIFRQVMVTIVVAENDTLIWLSDQKIKPCNLSTIAPLVINQVTD